VLMNAENDNSSSTASGLNGKGGAHAMTVNN
jgi:hypothetical protein